MGSPLGPLMADIFMCDLEEKLTRDGLMPQLYKGYVDDPLARMPSADVAAEFLSTLNGLHPRLTFTMELPLYNKIPFIDIEIVKNGTKLETQVYRKPTLDCSCTSKVTRINAIKTLYYTTKLVQRANN